MIQINSIFIVI